MRVNDPTCRRRPRSRSGCPAGRPHRAGHRLRGAGPAPPSRASAPTAGRSTARSSAPCARSGSPRPPTGAGAPVRARAAHLPAPARRPPRPARLRDRLGRGARAVQARSAPRACRPRSSSSTATGATGARSRIPATARPGQLQGQRGPLPVLPRRRACSCTRCPPSRRPTTCTAPASAGSRLRPRRPAPPARRDGAAGGAPLARLHRLGVRLPLRRRRRRPGSAAWPTPPASRPTGAPPSCSASRATSRPRARRWGRSRRCRRPACAPPASRAACTTCSTRSRRGCTSSTPSCSR